MRITDSTFRTIRSLDPRAVRGTALGLYYRHPPILEPLYLITRSIIERNVSETHDLNSGTGDRDCPLYLPEVANQEPNTYIRVLSLYCYLKAPSINDS